MSLGKDDSTASFEHLLCARLVVRDPGIPAPTVCQAGGQSPRGYQHLLCARLGVRAPGYIRQRVKDNPNANTLPAWAQLLSLYPSTQLNECRMEVVSETTDHGAEKTKPRTLEGRSRGQSGDRSGWRVDLRGEHSAGSEAFAKGPVGPLGLANQARSCPAPWEQSLTGFMTQITLAIL